MTAPSGLVLTHGAGGDSSHRLLIAMEERLELPVWRMDFPYRREGRRAPDRAPKLVAALRE
ncbi:MAG: dienelactone hydrolase, partial [Actinobacteria bacterium]|nr:dienelactone hydrolase [Actinomycetota bacterium]NIS30741.1 dienelactone hydrolase [Actinomycetota bacterium]NIT95262.1 dienelactone hydrolase [Actinomycetota bacterium]NIU18934.1 dienelactone hydrolase [Actinomycetota bacterium]NIU65953.1 dienelactone hydrolase [Actinomycetota bacterium]